MFQLFTAHDMLHGIVRAAECIPTNDTFTSALQPVFNLLIGGAGAIILKFLILGALVVILVLALIDIARSRNASSHISALAMVGVIVPVAIIVLVIAFTLIRALNNVCPAI